MNTEVANIFDLLLGPVSPDAAGVLGDTLQGAEDGVFDSILAELACLGTETKPGVLSDSRPGNHTGRRLSELSSDAWARLLSQSLASSERHGQSPCLSNPGLGEVPAEMPDGLIPQAKAEIASRPFSIFAIANSEHRGRTATAVQPLDSLSPVSIDDQSADKNIFAFNRRLTDALPRHDRISNESLDHMLSSRPVNLADGRQYKIESVEQGSGLLQLTLSDDSAPDGLIKVTLPLSRLTEGHQVQNTSGYRVSLDSNQTDSLQLHRLLDRLNLREISIESTGQRALPPIEAETDHKTEPLRISIVADDSGRRVVLRGQLSAEELRTPLSKGPVEPTTTEKAARPLPDGDRTFAPAEHARIDPQRLAQAAATDANVAEARPGFALTRQAGRQDVLGRNAQSTESRLDNSWRSEAILSNSREAGTEGGFGGSDQGSNAELNSRAGSGLDRLNANQPVRFQMPNDFGPAFRSGRQSITIRIEPEHLGPAKLTLTEKNGSLQARLIVNSPEAKTLIESSLDRLSRQLQQANVNVDSIEVTVSADSDQRQLFHERPEWTGRAMRPGRIHNEEEVELDGREAIMPSTMRNGAVAGGINLLA